ncbi:MAG: nitrate reductase [Pirellulales bacterium]|nr:nitrate reductase [Pirellulales bacterium]
MNLLSAPSEIDHRATIGEAICPYCGVGCRLWAEAAYGTVLRVKGAPLAPANRGGICAKGATLPQTMNPPDRLSQPQVRTGRRDHFRPLKWDQALRHVANRLADILQRHGPQAVAFYGSGQLDSEAAYLAVKLFKGCFGTNNTDSNSRLCMASSALGYLSSLGADGPPTCYDDVDQADLVLVVGSNMAEAHPVTFDRLKARRAAENGRPYLAVIDPRRTRTAAQADLHVPLAPGSDVALLDLAALRLARRGALDEAFLRDHVDGVDAFWQAIGRLDEAALVAAVGAPAATIDELVERIAASRAMLSFYCMGLGQSSAGVAKHNSLINLHLITGQISKPGAGPFSLTGQPNAMGGREVGLLAHQLPGYRLVADASHRREIEQYWRLPAGSISAAPGQTAVEMFRGLESGRLKAIWIAATNPAASLPDLHQVRRALERAELVIVQDVFHPTETTRLADVLLPAANWLEKEGTTTNSERMVSHSERLLSPAGAARPDWEIVAGVARAMGLPGFDYANRGAVWDEFIGLTVGRPCDLSGMPADRLRQEKQLQWPCPAVDHPGTKRRYLDRVFPTPNGRARLIAHLPTPPKEPADAEFPLVLTSGRIYAHWHTLTRTGKSDKLLARDGSPYVEIHPIDAERLGLAAGELATLQSRRGVMRVPVRINDSLRPGLLFAPFHWGDLWGDDQAVNYLTIAALDPQSKQPELKYCAVAVEEARLGNGSAC